MDRAWGKLAVKPNLEYPELSFKNEGKMKTVQNKQTNKN